MSDSDKPQWMELRRALWPNCSAARHALEMDQWQNSDGVVLVAEALDGQVVGFAEVSIRRDHVEGTSSAPVPYLEAWYVVPEHRRRGVGRALLKSVEAWALEAGFCELASDAECDDEDAIQAHQGLGFNVVDRTVHFVKRLKPRRVCVVPTPHPKSKR